MSTELVDVSNAIAAFDKVAAGLGMLQETYGGVIYDVTTTQGISDARAARLAIREPRYEVERLRKEAKAPIVALGRKLDAEAARITAELLKIETPIHEAISNEEARKEREKQERIAAEQRRVEKIQDRIADIRTMPTLFVNATASVIEAEQTRLRAMEIDDSFEEFKPQALAAKGEAFIALAALGAAALVRENEKAELERFRAEKAARDATAAANPPPTQPPPPLVLQPSPPFAGVGSQSNQEASQKNQPDWTQERPTDAQIVEAVAVTFSVTHLIALTWIKQVGRGKKVK